MKPAKTFWTIMLILFIIYISIFISSRNGYYEYSNKTKKTLTAKKMKEFEKDLKEGKKIDINNYISKKEKKYDNKVTNLGNGISYIINTGINKGLEGTFKIIYKMIN